MIREKGIMIRADFFKPLSNLSLSNLEKIGNKTAEKLMSAPIEETRARAAE